MGNCRVAAVLAAQASGNFQFESMLAAMVVAAEGRISGTSLSGANGGFGGGGAGG
jgi:hypothetical protein